LYHAILLVATINPFTSSPVIISIFDTLKPFYVPTINIIPREDPPRKGDPILNVDADIWIPSDLDMF
jgi:hypothetical protein